MAAKFEFDFGKLVEEQAKIQAGFQGIGEKADNAERKLAETSRTVAKVMNALEPAMQKITVAARSMGVGVEQLNRIAKGTEGSVLALLSKFNQQSLAASIQSKAWAGELKDLQQQLASTANLKVFVSDSEKLATLQSRLVGETRLLEERIKALGTETGKLNANTKNRLASETRMATAVGDLANKERELLQAEQLLGTQTARNAAVLRARIAETTKAYQEDTKLLGKLGETRRAYEGLQGGIQAQIAVQRTMNTGLEQAATFREREQNAVNELRRQHESLNGGLAEQAAQLRVLNQARQKEVTELTRERAKIEELQRALQSLNGGNQEQIARLQAQIQARRKAIAEDTRAVSAVQALTEAQKQLNAAKQGELEKLTRLQAKKDLLNGQYGRDMAQIQRQIAEQTHYNRLLTMSTGELLGFSAAQKRASAAIDVGSQSAAMLRASLSGLNTSIGMYTSSTVLAAAATYSVFSTLRNTVKTGSEFTATMARANAVMAPMASWVPDNMGAMEEQVRSLGQATVYTASEVAEGLVELGQAGLSAADAMLALKPSLNLALIGGISMGQSADIATNVMMTFGKEAKDLTDIVDLLARAATDSNTNVEQLANALTYAGPAAHTAGIDIKDTVAAIEALSNTGIKASRAGTGLRRLFVSLLNPTKKGAEMLDKYGISVSDAEGRTRSLVDILKQLNKALHNADVTEAERLGAVQDLVGLYATSPVAALIGQAGDDGNLEGLRARLDDISGAAEQMRNRIEDSLQFDWKQVTSSFEEAQLRVFKTYEYTLREMSSSASKYLIDLTTPIKEVQIDDNTKLAISELDLLIQKAQVAAEVIGAVLVGILAKKGLGGIGNMFGAFSADAKNAADRMGILATRNVETAVSMRQVQTAAPGVTAALRFQGQAAISTAQAMAGLSVAGAKAASALSFISLWGGRLLAAAGWVGLLVSVGAAISNAFGRDAEQDLIDHAKEVDNVRRSYENVKAAIESASVDRQKRALKDQIASEQQKIKDGLAVMKDIQDSIAKAKAEDLVVPQAAIAQLKSTELLVNAAKKAVENANTELGKLDVTRAEELSAVQTLMEKLAKLKELRAKEAEAKEEWEKREGQIRLKQYNAWQAAIKAANDYRDEVNRVAEDMDKAARSAESMQRRWDRWSQGAEQALAANALEKRGAAADKLAIVQKDLKDAVALSENQKTSGDSSGLDRTMQKLQELRIKEQELRWELEEQKKAFGDAEKALGRFHMTEAEKLAALKKELDEVRDGRAKYEEAKKSGGEGAGVKEETERLQRELRLQEEIKSLESSIERAKDKGSKGSVKETNKAAKEIDTLYKAYKTLRKEFNPVATSLAEIAQKEKDLTKLVEAGKISAEDKARALQHLKKAHYELTKEQDKSYQSLLKLREAYLESPFSATLKDAIELEKLLKSNKISLEEYNRIRKSMSKKDVETATQGLPEADLQRGDSASGPFSDWMATEIERVNGFSQFNKRDTELAEGYDNQKHLIDEAYRQKEEALEAQYGLEANYRDRLKKLHDEKDRELLQAKKQFSEQSAAVDKERVLYTEQMNTMVNMSIMATAENMLGMFASASSEATTAQKIAFVAQKAIAVAQIIMYAHLAAAKAEAELGVYAGSAMAAKILALGYANAGFVAALSIAELAGGGKDSGGSSGSSYAGAYDDGGFIPYNSYGIVGEYGPEIVHGPANVTSRKESAKQLSGGGEVNVTLSPQINVNYKGEGGGGVGSQTEMQGVANAVKQAVVSTLQEQMRPNGVLDSWIRNRRG